MTTLVSARLEQPLLDMARSALPDATTTYVLNLALRALLIMFAVADEDRREVVLRIKQMGDHIINVILNEQEDYKNE